EASAAGCDVAGGGATASRGCDWLAAQPASNGASATSTTISTRALTSVSFGEARGDQAALACGDLRGDGLAQSVRRALDHDQRPVWEPRETLVLVAIHIGDGHLDRRRQVGDCPGFRRARRRGRLRGGRRHFLLLVRAALGLLVAR